MLNKIYLVSGMALIALYVAVALSGWEFGHPEPQVLAADVRHAPGGYRSFHFWHSGYHGGK